MVVALAFTVVRDALGRVLLARRIDTGNWELPGGTIEIGESATAAARREVLEETGLSVSVTGLAGVFCDPGHVVVYPRIGQVRQQHVTLLHAVPAAGGAAIELRPDDDETDAVRWIELDDLGTLPIHPSVHRRIDHAVRTSGEMPSLTWTDSRGERIRSGGLSRHGFETASRRASIIGASARGWRGRRRWQRSRALVPLRRARRSC